MNNTITSKAAVNLLAETNTAHVTDEIKVRMYCHGFGDCFLVSFCSEGKPVYKMVIDCGMLTGDTEKLKKVIENIKNDCGGHVNLVVQTHEHKDHISGFNLKDNNGQLLWDQITVDEVWLAWTENTAPGGDPLAIELKQQFNDQKAALNIAMQKYREKTADAINEYNNDSYMRYYGAAQKRFGDAMEQLLGFYTSDISMNDKKVFEAESLFGLTTNQAMQYFIKRSKESAENKPYIRYWNPGNTADVFITGLNGIKFYFLGPPRNYSQLRKLDDKKHQDMYMTDFGLSGNFYSILNPEKSKKESKNGAPFEDYFYEENITGDGAGKSKPASNVNIIYYDPKSKWRTIEYNWLYNAGILGLHLDNYTNNTSLVIAIEMEKSGKVLLFPGDAQIGSWQSWTAPAGEKTNEPALQWKNKTGNVKTVKDLLANTVLYKVSHHGSDNATAKASGLELMTHPELAAIIPIDEVVAYKQGKFGWEMPADELYNRLKEKTRCRIIRLDTGNLLSTGYTPVKKKDKKEKEEEIPVPDFARPTDEQRSTFNALVSESAITIQDTNSENRPLYREYSIKG